MNRLISQTWCFRIEELATKGAAIGCRACGAVSVFGRGQANTWTHRRGCSVAVLLKAAEAHVAHNTTRTAMRMVEALDVAGKHCEVRDAAAIARINRAIARSRQ